MRKRIIALLLVLVISSSFLGLCVWAEEAEPQLSVVAQALSLEDSIYIKYYVNGVNANDIKLLVWTEPKTDYIYGTQTQILSSTGTDEIAGKNCLVFDFKGLVAKEMAKNVYVRAYTEVNGQAYYSNVKKYSVLTYAYNKLGKTGTATTDANLIELLNNLLAYGAAAQNYLDYQKDRLVTQPFYQVKVANGTLSDQCKTGLYLTGDAVSIYAADTDADGKVFHHWVNSAGTTVATTNPATITVGAKNEVYTAVYEAALVPSEGLTFTYSSRQQKATVTGKGSCTDSSIVIPAEYSGYPVTNIADEAFADDTSLTQITVPQTVTAIGAYAFFGCNNLTDIYYLGTSEEWDSITKGEDSIPAGITIHCKDPEVTKYTVTFKDYNGNVLKTEDVIPGENATPPADPTREGYVFISWQGIYTNVQANTTVIAQYEAITQPVIVVSSASAKAGETVTVDIKLRNNPGIAASILKVNYDSSVLTMASFEYGSSFAKDGETPPSLNSPVPLTWSNSSANVVGDVTYAVLTFTVNANALAGTTTNVEVSYDNSDIIDLYENDVNFLIRNGTVTVQ